MMNLISSPGQPLQGVMCVPGDKSLSHRAALFAALAEGESRIENFLVSGVTQAMLQALTALGVGWALEGDETGGERRVLVVQGRGLGGLRSPAAALDCGNSATTMRMLAGALAASMAGALSAAGVTTTLDGSAGLRRRPMNRIVDPLQQMGVEIKASDGCAPLYLRPSNFPLRPLNYSLPVASAQIKTCLLLAALAAGGPTTLVEPGPSRDHSERMLRSMGVMITAEKGYLDGKPFYKTSLTPPKGRVLSPLAMTLPGDFSSAAFLIVAALITPGSDVTIQGVGLNSARTGLLDALLGMGADICITGQTNRSDEPVGDLHVKYSRLHRTSICGEQVVRMIDEFPIFAIAAAYASGVTTVNEAAELRLKESDRIGVLCEELRKLGVQAVEHPDGFTIQGGSPVQGGVIAPHGDHRLAMSLAVAGLASQAPVYIQDAQIIEESYPEFTQTLQALGGRLVVE
jgi:3-phosphoshikimate 1-carboxyvinyltransferase